MSSERKDSSQSPEGRRPGHTLPTAMSHTPHSQTSAMGARKEQGGLVRTRNNERENWPCRVSFEFPKEIGASQIVPEIEL